MAELANQAVTGEKARKLSAAEADGMLGQVEGWKKHGEVITKAYSFKNFHETMGFVNAVAHVANKYDHHPDLAVSYNTCEVSFTSHSAGGLTENDFILAAKVDAAGRL